MSWHFLQGQEAASWAGTCLDGAPAALLKLIPTPEECYLLANGTDCCRTFQSGTTCEPSTASLGAGMSMSLAGASPAKTLARTEAAPDSKGNDLDYGAKWQGSLAKYDRVSRLWRTAQCSLLADSEEFSETWPKWGSMLGGVAFLRHKPAHLTNGKGSGFALGLVRKPTHSVPTPTASDHIQRKCTNGLFNPETNKAVNLNRLLGGVPNPDWSEWLMGWPIKWTDLGPLEMGRFHLWLRLHGGF